MPLKVLFIGNSHTYLHKMPWLIQCLARAEHRGCSILVTQRTENGAGLKTHWDDRRTIDQIDAEPWDAVVLQDRSGGPIEDKAAFYRYARLLAGVVREKGADPVFYMTWAHRDRPETQGIITEAYRTAARQLEAGLVPVGMAWERVRREKPDIPLYHSDGRHAGPAGAYLAACVFYATLFNTSPAGLPATFTVKGKRRVDLDADTARYLQQTAFRTVQNGS